jgi:hypothetical protein
MNRRTKLLNSSVIVSALALALSGDAFAGTTNQPGSMCVKWYPTEPEPRLSSSAIRNPSTTQTLRVDCPVVRTDFDGFLHDAGVEDSWVRVTDRNPLAGRDVRCQLVSYARVGSSSNFWGGAVRFSSGSNNAVQQLNTNGVGGENGVSHLYFSCHIPPVWNGQQSDLVTYRVKQ